MWTDGGVPGRDAVENRRWEVALSLAFGLQTPTRVTISHLHLAQDHIRDFAIPWVPANTNSALTAYSDGQAPVDRRNFYGVKTRDYEDTVTDVATAQLEHDFISGFTRRNLTRSTSLHNVRPVTRGARLASFFWIQSMVRDDGQRMLLFDLDSAIQQISHDTPNPGRHLN